MTGVQQLPSPTTDFLCLHSRHTRFSPCAPLPPDTFHPATHPLLRGAEQGEPSEGRELKTEEVAKNEYILENGKQQQAAAH